MATRPKALSKAASTTSMSVEQAASGTDKRSSLFSKWRRASSSARPDGASAQHAALDGKELRDAVWKQQRQRESLPPSVARPMRVIRYSPPRVSAAPAAEDDEDDAADDDFSNGSARGPGPQEMFNYDGVPSQEDFSSSRRAAPLGTSKSGRSMQRQRGHDEERTSRLSLTFSRLSFSSSARNSLADYKAKKYDVEWKKDDEVPDCQVCHLAFTKWSRRRHHCRVCGDIICDDCSPDQVHIDGRFTRAKRACTACFGLLEAMMHLGDPHVKMVVEKEAGTREWIDRTPPRKSPTATTTTQHVYHDRLAEIQRVTAAGSKARRHGEVRKCVVRAQWLRAWLAFTRNHGDDANDDFQTKKDRAESTNSSLASSMGDGEPPGPIENLSLLVMSKGRLVPRDDLVPVDNQDFTGSGNQGCGDYQTIPLEVWDVLSRYYGGGPRIEIVPSTIVGEPDRWVVDAAAVLRFGRAQKTNPNAAVGSSSPPLTVEEKVLERALVERHDPFSIFLDVPAMSNRAIYDPQQPYASATVNDAASSSSSSTAPPASWPPAINRSVSDSYTAQPSMPPPRSGGGNARSPVGIAPRTKPEQPRGPSSHRQPARPGYVDPERTPAAKPPPQQYRQPQSVYYMKPEPEHEPGPGHARDHRVRHATPSQNQPGSRGAAAPPPAAPHVPTRRASGSPKEKTAASAASAFALAMKEARLKQQRAIASGSSRAAA